MNFKTVHIGSLISQRVTESRMASSRICNFLKCTHEEIKNMYLQEYLSTDTLLKWSKLLEYDFFRIYSQHLILYAPIAKACQTPKEKSKLPQFRKSVYTQDVIDFILGQIQTGEMSAAQIMERYKIPKTTLYKWIIKYNRQEK